MNRIAGILVFFLLAGAMNQLFGQAGMAPGAGSASTEMTVGGEELSFYIDEESNTIYIDFEPIRVNINQIMLKDANGSVLFQDTVSDLPVNAIYELDMKQYNPGMYRVELHTFTSVLAKDIQIQ